MQTVGSLTLTSNHITGKRIAFICFECIKSAMFFISQTFAVLSGFACVAHLCNSNCYELSTAGAGVAKF